MSMAVRDAPLHHPNEAFVRDLAARSRATKERADERTRTAYPCSLRVCSQWLLSVAGVCKYRISKGLSILSIAPYRANRVTMPVTLPAAAGTRRPHSRSPEVEVRHHCKRQLCYLRQPFMVQNTPLWASGSSSRKRYSASRIGKSLEENDTSILFHIYKPPSVTVPRLVGRG